MIKGIIPGFKLWSLVSPKVFPKPSIISTVFGVAGCLITNLRERCWLILMNSSKICSTDFSRDWYAQFIMAKEMNNSDISCLKKMTFRYLSLNQIELIKEDEWEGKWILFLSFTNQSCKFHQTLTIGQPPGDRTRSLTNLVSGFGNQIVFFLKSKKAMQMQSLLISRHSKNTAPTKGDPLS